MSKASVLFLQGPLGPFFRELAKVFSDAGYITHKINFNAGDRFFSGADFVIDFPGTPGAWPDFLRAYLQQHQISSVFLLGDCRLYHRLAKPVCDQLGINFMVFEEGYVRPDTITLERHGVNALSRLDFSTTAINASNFVSMKAPVAIGATMKSRAVYAALYYCAAYFSRRTFLHYIHHRTANPFGEAFSWIRGWVRKWLVKSSDKKVHHKLTTELSGRFVLVPLQVHDDSQKIYHSDYLSVEAFIEEVACSFAKHASKDQVLCFKHHPMDRGYTHYGQFISHLTSQLGLSGRILYCHDNPLPELYRHACSVVTVNSTVGLSALLHNIPVKTMGKAIYDIKGLTHQEALDSFWQRPQPVDMELFEKFHSYLYRKTQVNGSFFKYWDFSCNNVLEFYEKLTGRSVVTTPAVKGSSKDFDGVVAELKAA